LIFGLLQQLQALGLDLPTVLSQLGMNGGKMTDATPKPAEGKSSKPLT
jgi:hypothetical protein